MLLCHILMEWDSDMPSLNIKNWTYYICKVKFDKTRTYSKAENNHIAEYYTYLVQYANKHCNAELVVAAVSLLILCLPMFKHRRMSSYRPMFDACVAYLLAHVYNITQAFELCTPICPLCKVKKTRNNDFFILNK